MINSKQRAKLRGLANSYQCVVMIGKDGVTDEVVKSADQALEARELIKAGVLDNSETGASECARILSERTSSEIVCVIGRKIILYRMSKNKDKRIISSQI